MSSASETHGSVRKQARIPLEPCKIQALAPLSLPTGTLVNETRSEIMVKQFSSSVAIPDIHEGRDICALGRSITSGERGGKILLFHEQRQTARS